ncbi:MAG: heme exporter protein A [Planctomycetota bacterium]|jgi:heme exporter protein A
MQAPLSDDNISVEDSTELLLEARGLECCKNELVLFRDLEFALGRGEILQIDGANGSGKTSLIRILCGLAQADPGELRWFGKDIQSHRSEYLQDIVYVAHSNAIKIDLTPLENLALVQALCLKTSNRTLEEVLTVFGLLDYADLPAGNMSSGQRRRLALARILISAARLWVLDEPFTSLDDASKQVLRNLIIKHVENAGSVILTTHETVSWQDCKLKRIEL